MYRERAMRQFGMTRSFCTGGGTMTVELVPLTTNHLPPTTYGKIFPGFRIPAGSNAAFTRFMSAI